MVRRIAILLIPLLSACTPSGVAIPTSGSLESTPIPSETLPAPSPIPSHTVEVVPTERETSRILTICIKEPPVPLNPYTGVSVSNAILQAVNDGQVDEINFTYYPVILERLPSLKLGDIQIRQVEVMIGDIVYDVVSNHIMTYTGPSITMDQMIVRFQLRPDITWADGEPLTAHDSGYAYELLRMQPIDAAKEWFSPVEERLLKTYSYQVLDEHTIEWVGVPGLVSASFAAFFFPPMPKHLNVDLQTDWPPVGWGAFGIQSWAPGDAMSVVRNPRYFRNGLPNLDEVIFRFIEPPYDGLAEKIVSSGCQIVSLSLGTELAIQAREELTADGRYQVVSTPRVDGLQLVFNLGGSDSPIQDIEVRKAIGHCLDRDRIAAMANGVLADSFIHPSDAAYGPAEAPSSVTPVDKEFLKNTVSKPLRMAARNTPIVEEVALMIIDELEVCGVQIQADFLGSETFYQPWPEGPVFSGQYDLALFPIGVAEGNTCQWYHSGNIPSQARPEGINIGQYHNDAFDELCRNALTSLENEARADSLAEARAIWENEMTAVPLYWYTHSTIVDCHVRGYRIDSTGNELWNIEEIELLQECEQSYYPMDLVPRSRWAVSGLRRPSPQSEGLVGFSPPANVAGALLG